MRYHQCILLTVLMFSGILQTTARTCAARTEDAGTGEQQNLEKSVVLIRSVKQDFYYVTPWKKKAMRQSIV